MYIVTNRQIDESERGLKIFGTVPSSKGPNELRLVKVTRSGNSYRTELIDDKLSEDDVKKINSDLDLALDPKQDWYASLSVAAETLSQAEREKKHVLFYAHGYNNDLNDIVDTAQDLEQSYNVIVVVFSWPSNGGGAVSGTLSYLSDKADARASATAFSRFADKVRGYHELISRSREELWFEKAKAKHPSNPQKAQELFTELANKDCKVTLNLLCHSMGNYLLKHALVPSSSAFRQMIFFFFCLVAADTNNENHADWVDAMDFRTRLYIVINEGDFALAWSRRKPGEAQKVRLGHSLDVLNARNAKYINVTGADWVENKHTYFTGEAVQKNRQLHTVFTDLFEGNVAENNPQAALKYRVDLNAYEL
ncbi:MAG: alpha/beta hydrolase [Planctomycetaceae bacterium]|nr:alpha/beta hydrolase [Planctomycetaceae bacterium]